MTRKGLLLTLLVVLLAVGSSWLSERSEKPRLPPPGTPEAVNADYFMRGFSASSRNTNGEVTHRLEADYLAHYPDDGHADVDHPRITLFDPKSGGGRWLITADKGRIDDDGKQIILSGKVKLTGEGERGLTLQTSRLRIRPDTQYADTHRELTLSGPGTTLKARGMQLYLAEGRLILLSQIRGHYAPKGL